MKARDVYDARGFGGRQGEEVISIDEAIRVVETAEGAREGARE